MMEQAINLFNKGLLIDTHPMVQGNDTLTDCLNGTMITMSGNEVVLLNDMGNRRVDNAFLPSGFEPVGMKEYGGIIYVASYNPITNRSLVGSFPSPERKINSLDDKSLGNQFNFFDAFYNLDELNESTPERRFINSDTVMLPLTGDTSLHAGDKFIIYSDEIKLWEKYLSNYNNIFSNKIISPKNKHLTLQIGVLNSQNLFVDITKTLKRWRDGEILKYDSSYSEDYIFNDGYFISDSSFEGDSSSYTIDDRLLIKERQTKPANTYAYKLVGPLYLKAQLNHIQEFSFNINGDRKINDREIKLVITADIIYNCPDGTKNNGKPYNDNYLWDGCGEIENWEKYTSKIKCPFDFYYKTNGKYTKVLIENPNYPNSNSIKYSTPIYINNAYKVTATMELNITLYNGDMDGKLLYFIGVDSGIPLQYTPENKPYYIETLSTYGELDLSKLGSGYVGLKSFRFFNSYNPDGNSSEYSTTLSYVLELYPKLNLKFDSLTLRFIDIESNETVSNNFTLERPYINGLPINNGKSIVSFKWDASTLLLKPKKLYLVLFIYFTENGLPGIIRDTTRWLLTTELFNDCYNPRSVNFVEDYLSKIYSPDSEEYINFLNFSDLATINYNNILYNKLLLDLETDDKSGTVTTNYKTTKTSGKLIDTINKSILYKTIDSCNVKLQLNNYVDVIDKDLYPSMQLINNKLVNIGRINTDLSDLEIEYVKNGNIGLLTLNSFGNYRLEGDSEDLITSLTTNNGNYLDVTINYKNKIISLNNSGGNRFVKDGFYKLSSDKFKTDVLANSISHSGFFVANKDWTGKDDEHWFGLILNKESLTAPVKNGDDVAQYGNGGNFRVDAESETILDFSDTRIAEMYYNMKLIDSKCTFAFIFSALNIVGRPEDEDDWRRPLAYVPDIRSATWSGIRFLDDSSQGYCPITCCKVWWRNGIADEWVLLNNNNGMFGGSSTSASDLLPEKLSNRKFVYIGLDNWSCGDQYSDINEASSNYNTLYLGQYKLNLLGTDINGRTLTINCGLQEHIFDLITNFLDPEKNIVYDMYKKTNLYEHNLRTIDNSSYLYNKPYSGNVDINVEYIVPDCKVVSTIENSDNILILFNRKVLNILPFHTNTVQIPTYKISVPISSNVLFEDDVNNIISNEEIGNIYLETGVFRDINYEKLSGDTIYKITDEGLKPLTNPPYKLYRETGLNFNSLVSISNYSGSSSGPSLYLRAYGDEDSLTALKFSGGNLRVVDYTKFKNLS